MQEGEKAFTNHDTFLNKVSTDDINDTDNAEETIMMDSFIRAAQEKVEMERTEQAEQMPQQENPPMSGGLQKRVHAVDQELEEILNKQRAGIKVVGCGGGGGNTLNRISEVGIMGAKTIAVNTDAQDLLYTDADHKVLIGRELTRGMGAGGDPATGEQAAREQEKEIRDLLSGSDMIFVTCGMGGGTGTGSAPVVAEAAKKSGGLVVGIVTIPFTMEGGRRLENALHGLEQIKPHVDTLIVIPNDKLLELAPDLPLHTAFKVADEILTNAVKGIAELITKPGLVNLDFADIKAVMRGGGLALIGVGESDSDNRAIEAVEKAIANPLLDIDITGAQGALINVSGGSSMTLSEARGVVETVSSRLDTSARIIWGAQIDENLKKAVQVMLIVTGVKSSEFYARQMTAKKETEKKSSNELGIEFVD